MSETLSEMLDRHARELRALMDKSDQSANHKGEGARILDAIAQRHEITVADIKGPSRRHCFTVPRQEACSSLRAIGWSVEKIGDLLGGRHHTTVMHGIKQHEHRVAQ